ncbi:MAG: acetyltransferase [Methanobacteriota archaeon]
MMKKKPRKTTQRKKELDQQRTAWRRHHRTLNGRLILYPEKPAEHINARGSKLYNWFWNRILLEVEPQDIPGIISGLQDQLTVARDLKTTQMYRTMIGMAEDAYQLKRLEDIKDYDPELVLGKKPVFNSETGVIYKDGTLYTTDYTEDESAILLRDIEGAIKDVLSSDSNEESTIENIRTMMYKDWAYMEKK